MVDQVMGSPELHSQESEQVAIHLQDLTMQDTVQEQVPEGSTNPFLAAETTAGESGLVAQAVSGGGGPQQHQQQQGCARCLPFSCFCSERVWLSSGLEFKDIPMIRAPPPAAAAVSKTLAHAAPLMSARADMADTDSGEEEEEEAAEILGMLEGLRSSPKMRSGRPGWGDVDID